jgi:hypothetical protein
VPRALSGGSAPAGPPSPGAEFLNAIFLVEVSYTQTQVFSCASLFSSAQCHVLVLRFFCTALKKQSFGSVFIWYGSGSSIIGWILILIQSRSRVLMTKNENNLQLKKLNLFWIKNHNLPIPRPPERMSKLQKKPSALKREHSELQHMKFLHFFYFWGSVLPSLIRIPGYGFRIRARIHWPDWIRIHWPDWIRIRIGNTVKKWLRIEAR